MRLCLNMIVRNESERIERCLASVAPHIASACIVDTGSTDDTREKIRAFFTASSIPLTLAETAFVNFATTRNYALERARILGGADYLLLVDADMELVVEDQAWADRLDAPAYRMLQRNGGLAYQNVRLLRADQRTARYIGVTHEYLSFEGDSPNLGGAWFLDHADGANRAGKFERDAALLRGDVADKARSFYYLGQSLRDLGDKRGAAEAYGICAKIDGWEEERWHAELSRARCLRDYGAPEWALVALSAFGRRPTRAEPLYDLAKHFREQGLNETSLLFSARGLDIQRPAEDLLFIEDAVYDWGLREEYAICAYYSDAHRARGRQICNDLALDRSVPVHVRETAWRNLFFYTRPLRELAPSFETQKLTFVPLNGYRPCNPSVCRIQDTTYLNIRTVNYLIGDDGRYIMPETEPEIRTRNFLFTLGRDLTATMIGEIRDPADLPAPSWGGVLGFEDIRLFERDGTLWCAASTRQANPEGWGEMFVARIDGDNRLVDWHIARPEGARQHEKNWMPLADGSGFIYRMGPTVVVNLDGGTRQTSEPAIAAETWGGSAQLIPFDGGYLGLIHERKAHPDPMHGQRNYQRRFVWFDKDLYLQRWSDRFVFGDGEGEFCCGICRHPDQRHLIISYGVLDREAWLATIAVSDVRYLLGLLPSGETAAPAQVDALERYWAAKKADEERAAYRGMRGMGFPAAYGEDEEQPGLAYREPPIPVRRLVPRHPPQTFAHPLAHCDLLSHSWALSQTNRPLRTRDEIEVAVAHLRNLQLPFHHDPGYQRPEDNPKNWDNLIAISHATATTDLRGAVVDAGGTRESAFLRSLGSLGYRELRNFNTDSKWAGYADGITYEVRDITATLYEEQRFDFVACLSVIEHGVDVRAFLREMARVIRPGGHLFLSFDYWQDPIDCGDRTAFGAPVRIFDRVSVESMVGYAADQGLSVVGEVDYACRDRVVSWLGLDFTFFNLLLRREAGSRAS